MAMSIQKKAMRVLAMSHERAGFSWSTQPFTGWPPTVDGPAQTSIHQAVAQSPLLAIKDADIARADA